ncbi:MAG: COG4315 family predicted lipoprotein [Arenicella sp.]
MTYINTKLALTLTLLIGSAGAAHAADKAKVLTDKAGMTLYTFDKDSAGVSNCYGGCAQKWPPFTASENAALKPGWSIIQRKDGSMQWAYKDQPLYTWVGDTKAGDTTGDGIKGVWHTATKQKAKDSKVSYYKKKSYKSDY